MGNEVLSTEVLRHGAYICLTVPKAARAGAAAAAVPALGARLKLHNEFHAEAGHPPDAIAFLKRIDAVPAPSPTTTSCRPTRSSMSPPARRDSSPSSAPR
jgi:hypothetical protein